MTRLWDFLRTSLNPGYGIQIDVNAFNNHQIELYEGLGFSVSTVEQRGVPMHLCLTNQITIDKVTICASIEVNRQAEA